METTTEDLTFKELAEQVESDIKGEKWHWCKCSHIDCNIVIDMFVCRWIDGEPVCSTHGGKIGRHN